MAADIMIIVGIEEVRIDEEEVHGEVVELYLHHHLRLRGSGPRSTNIHTELPKLAIQIGILTLLGPSYLNPHWLLYLESSTQTFGLRLDFIYAFEAPCDKTMEGLRNVRSSRSTF